MSYIPAALSTLGSLFGGGSSSGLMGGVNSAEQNLENTEMEDQISQMNQQASLDQVKTKSQMAASLTDAENQISSAWQEVAKSKDQSEEAILHTDTQATAQA